jgi:hypothetical protein
VIVYVLAMLSTTAATLYRPAHSALLQSLCLNGHELTSANVVRGMLDSIATLVGPLMAAVILEFTNVAVVFAVASAASLAAAAVLLRLRYDAPLRPAAPRDAHLMADVAEGVRTIVCRQNRESQIDGIWHIASHPARPAPFASCLIISLENFGINLRELHRMGI